MPETANSTFGARGETAIAFGVLQLGPGCVTLQLPPAFVERRWPPSRKQTSMIEPEG